MILNVGPQAGDEMTAWAFGLERLTLAQGGEITSYEESRTALLDALEAVVGPDGDLPAGYQTVEQASS